MKKLLSLGLLAITLLGVTACTGGKSIAASTVAIDVNPSIVLELDENDKVINIIKNNEDADIIIGDMDLIGVDYNVAMNALIGSMVSNGYISDIANSILLSVQNDDETKENELMDELSKAVEATLNSNHIEGSIITQELEFSDDAEELAEQLEISEAKAELILDIIEVDPRMVLEELAVLSINDLNLLLESKNIILENVEKTGAASELGMISIEEAYQLALVELAIDETLIVEFEVELEQEDGIMVYEIEIETDTDEYEILIDAKEGTVYVEVEDEEDDEDDDEDEEDMFPADALTEEAVMELIAASLELDQTLITDLDIEQEVDNGIAYYEIEFEYNEVEYELEVDAVTGDIYSNSMDENGFDHQDDDDDDLDTEDDDETDIDDEDDVDGDDTNTDEETSETDDEDTTDDPTPAN